MLQCCYLELTFFTPLNNQFAASLHVFPGQWQSCGDEARGCHEGCHDSAVTSKWKDSSVFHRPATSDYSWLSSFMCSLHTLVTENVEKEIEHLNLWSALFALHICYTCKGIDQF